MKTEMKYVVTWFWFLLVFKGGDQSLENSKSQNQQLTKNMADSTAAGTIRNDGKIWCKCSAHDEEGCWVGRSTYFRHIQADRALQTLSKRESREFLQLQRRCGRRVCIYVGIQLLMRIWDFETSSVKSSVKIPKLIPNSRSLQIVPNLFSNIWDSTRIPKI